MVLLYLAKVFASVGVPLVPDEPLLPLVPLVPLEPEVPDVPLTGVITTPRNVNTFPLSADKEKKTGYKEFDELGGFDPYSASKASVEIMVKSYVASFFSNKKNIRIATARAGNVVGGGDWSKNRLIPDCVKCWAKNKFSTIRNPESIRPWQHVLEALHGYLLLAIALKKNKNFHGQI